MSVKRGQKRFQRDQALYRQVADRLQLGLLQTTPPGQCLPSDRELAQRWQVSMRTVREALLVLEAEGRVQRQQGRGSVVCQPVRPVALFSELNLLHPATPRFFGFLLSRVRDRLETAGQSTRLYTGRHQAGADFAGFNCPELIEDAEAGRLAGIVALTSELDTPRLQRLHQAGLPMVSATGPSSLALAPFGLDQIPPVAVRYLAENGCRRIGMIGWNPPGAGGYSPLASAFAKALAIHNLPCVPAWCRVDMPFASPGAGWEAFREIWFAATEKPDALLVADENFLTEVIMAILELGLRIPHDLVLISHQTRHVEWSLPLAVARVEEDVDLFAELLTDQVQAALAGRPTPAIPAGVEPFRLVPLPDHAAAQRPGTETPSESITVKGTSL